MDSAQLIEFNTAFSSVFPEFLKPLTAIVVVGLLCSLVKKICRIN